MTASGDAIIRTDAGEASEASSPLALLIGNPNVGKTTLFNALSGQSARVGNYPGITVERRTGRMLLSSDGRPIDLADSPGTYSLAARSAEEQITMEAALGFGEHPKPDLVVAVVDATQVVRNLYLVLQLVELQLPVIIVLNMIDEAGEHAPSATKISELFGVPCVPTDARSGAGIDELKQAIVRALENPPKRKLTVDYPNALVRDADRVAEALPQTWRSTPERDRALALWALTSLDDDDELTGIDEALRSKAREAHAQSDRDIDFEVISSRYRFLDDHAASFEAAREHPEKRRSSESVDRILLHPVAGFAVFVLLMLVVFQALFSWSDPMIGVVESGVGALQTFVGNTLPAGTMTDLLTEGVIGGVGNVIVFLPQILLLFLFIGLLEDSGYMARVAYLMDRIMKSLGLHGRAFVPMLSGFACAIPAIMATRTMERHRDRLLTMMVIPLMTCSARLPVYTLIIAALFPPSDVFGWVPVQGLLLVAMYLFSTAITLLAAAVLGRTAIKGRRIPLILELPPYRLPKIGATLRMMWERSASFLREAGTIILVCTVVLWGLLSFPKPPESRAAPTAIEAPAEPDAAQQAAAIEQSYGGRLGKAIEPVLAPLGFDWKIGVGIIGAFAAREVFVSTMAIVYGVGEVDDEAKPLREKIRAETRADGKPVYTPLVGLSLMVFFALACQCMSTLAVVRRETRSWKWPGFLLVYMTGLAYLASLLVFQVGRVLGF